MIIALKSGVKPQEAAKCTLIQALDNKMEEAIPLLVKYGADVDRVTVYSVFEAFTPLLLAIKDKNLVAVKMLIQEGASINKGTTTHPSPLLAAINTCAIGFVKENTKRAIIEEIMNHKPDLKVTTSMGYTALATAIIKYDFETVKLLRKAGAEVDGNAFLAAATCSDLRFLESVIDDVPDVNHADFAGMTAMHVAAKTEVKRTNTYQSEDEFQTKRIIDVDEEGNIDAIKLLLLKKANVDSRDNVGKTPLMMAVEEGFVETAKFLIYDAGADVNACDNKGNSVMHYFVRTGIKKVIKFGASLSQIDRSIKNNDGQTALDLIDEYHDKSFQSKLKRWFGVADAAE
jgi:ankyrin repeat protein